MFPKDCSESRISCNLQFAPNRDIGNTGQLHVQCWLSNFGKLKPIEGDISMKKVFLMGAVLLLGTALTFGQDTNSGSSSSSQTGASASSQTSSPANQNGTTTTRQQTTTTTEQTTSGNAIRGCLSGSSGNWMLTDATGVSYQLRGGDESQLSANMNKEVEVMGTPGTSASASASNSPDNSAGANAGSTGNTPDNNTGSAGNSTAHASATSTKTLDVTSVRKVADSCSNTNQTAPQQ
jgi:hypothetical protein